MSIEVLDDFKPKPQTDTPAPQPPKPPAPAPEDFDELAFMNQLEKDMAKMMGQAAQQSGVSDPAGFEDTINQGADAFTKQLEESGIAPGDFIKQLLADVMAEEGEKGQSSASAPTGASAGAAPAPAGSEAGAGPESFNDAIQRTINRMKESGDKATAAASEDNTDDLIAQLLKAMEAGGDGSGGDEGDLTKIFMGMMEQLSNKDMLYEPMKELDTKFGPWLKENKGKGKVSDADMERYEKQAQLVGEIVRKFEEPSYTDEDPGCREYVWEKMQAVCPITYLVKAGYANNSDRCKQLEIHQMNLSLIPGWMTSRTAVVVSPIVRSNDIRLAYSIVPYYTHISKVYSSFTPDYVVSGYHIIQPIQILHHFIYSSIVTVPLPFLLLT